MEGGDPAGNGGGRAGDFVDILPTALAAAGLPVPAGQIIDGRNLLPVIRGTVDKVHDFLVWDNARGPFAVYQDGWKLVRERERGAKGKVRDSLFHLPDDPAEEKDLAAMRPQKVRELLALHEDSRKRTTRDSLQNSSSSPTLEEIQRRK